MSVICIWCSRFIKKETPIGTISHGICRACADKLQFDEEGMAMKPCKAH